MIAPVQDIVVNAANEGIPVCAIARIVAFPAADVYEALHEAKAIGRIADVPKADWPPGTKVAERLPALALPSDADLGFLCKKAFKLTNLEAGFLVVLIRNRQVEKSRLHNVVEQQRMTRQSQPNEMEATDPKMVDVIICKLRKKLKVVDKGLKIETIWGGGYYIETAMKPRIIAAVNGDDNAPQEVSPAVEPDPNISYAGGAH